MMPSYEKKKFQKGKQDNKNKEKLQHLDANPTKEDCFPAQKRALRYPRERQPYIINFISFRKIVYKDKLE